jgi:hypothetical protein
MARNMARALALLFLARASRAAVFKCPGMNIPVYTMVNATSVRQISAVTSSFVFEGTASYAWRDDSMFDAAYDDEPYKNEYALMSNWTCTDPITSAQLAPLFAIDFQSKLSVSYSNFKLTVSYGQPPEWTGLANANFSLTYNFTTEGEPTPVFVVGTHAFAVTFTQQQNLVDFPFDKQTATFSFVNSVRVDQTPLQASPCCAQPRTLTGPPHTLPKPNRRVLRRTSSSRQRPP